jgi:hypothetical protein
MTLNKCGEKIFEIYSTKISAPSLNYTFTFKDISSTKGVIYNEMVYQYNAELGKDMRKPPWLL